MALYGRIFPHWRDRDKKKGRWGFRSGRSHKKDYNFSSPEVLTSHKSWQAPEFDQEKIRLLVFNECDLKGRKLLFDSKAIKKNDEKTEASPAKGNPCGFARRFGGNAGSKNNPALEAARQQESLCSSGDSCSSKYTFLRPSPDIKLLGEMMYGSVAMSYRGPTIKVHTIRSPPELMLSQVFVLRPKENSDQDNISLAPVELMVPRCATNCPARESIAHSLPVAVPPSSPYNSIDEDSGVVCGSGSFLTPFPSPGSSVSSNQSNSFHRRWMRSQVTSMEYGVRRKSSLETVQNVDEPMNRRRHPKIGLGVVISLFEEAGQERSRHFQTFFFSHFTLFEGHFHRLSLAVEKALIHQRRTFIIPIMDALDEFRSAVFSLYCAPRIQRPIWLNMMTYQMQRGHLCEHLVHELMAELEMHNSKQTNFFFSRLLTAVLMHHLAWVSTVIPAEAAPSRAYLDKHSSKLLDTLAKSHPYNPLWAQLGDIFGAIGFPVKVAKTIVVGRRADVVCRLLYILSYFIRCSEVHEIPEQREKIHMEYDPTFELCKIEPENKSAEGADIVHTGGGDAISKTGGVFSDSGDSGFENSEERLLDNGESIDNGAVQHTEGGTEKMVDSVTNSVKSVSLLDPKLTLGNRQSLSLANVKANSSNVSSGIKSADEGQVFSGNVPDRWHGGSSLGSEVGSQGVTGYEAATNPALHSITEVPSLESRDRPPSAGLYPDLQTILSAASEEAIINGDISIRTSQPPQTQESKTVPLVQLNNEDLLVPRRERIVAVGSEAPMEPLNPQPVSVGGPVIYPKTFDDKQLDSKREHAVAVGRSSVQVENQVGLEANHSHPNSCTKANPDELVHFESGPGHDRCHQATATTQPLSLDYKVNDFSANTPLTESQESTKTVVRSSPSLYPTAFLDSMSVEVTPVPSCDNTDNESVDLTPPVPRRNKRFPLTSPLALAHQEAVRAKELKTEKEDASSQEASAIGDHTEMTDNPRSDARGQQSSPIGHRVDGRDFQVDTTDPGTGKHPTSPVKRQTSRSFSDLGRDAGGGQTTPVRRQASQESWSPFRNYKRCFSTGSTASSGFSDTTLMDCEELPMAFSEPITPETDPGESYVDNFGRSLLGGYSQSYVSDMALHGVPELDRKQVLSDLVLASQHSVLDEEIVEAVCIVADTDNWTVELLSSERSSPTADKPISLDISVAECIDQLLESVHCMCHLRMPSDFCLMHLEDQLQEVYFKSTALAAYLDKNPRASPKELTRVLGFEPSDLPLLLSIISVHSPNVIRSALRESYEKRQDGAK